MFTRDAALVVSVAAVLAALIYMLKLLRRIAASVDFWTSLPSQYGELVRVTRTNTEAIAALTRRLDAMDRPSGRRGLQR